jgi:hypothetical protein
VISYADAGYLTGDAGFEITAPDGSRLQVTVLRRALARPQGSPASCPATTRPDARSRC